MCRLVLRPIMIAKCLPLFLLLLGSVRAYCADHPDRNHRPSGTPEGVLSGVYINVPGHHSIRNADGVFIEPISEVLRTLGKPDKVINKNKCEDTYIWETGDVLLQVGTGCIYQTVQGRNIMRAKGAYSVEVWGNRSHGSIGKTGRGLGLGDPLAKMRHLYGLRCECGHYSSGTGTQDAHGERYAYYAEYQWGETVELDVDANAQGHIVHILLRGDLE